MYCGDEVSAIVGDIGTYESKFGFAGADMPKVLCPSAIGSTKYENGDAMNKGNNNSQYHVGTNALFASHQNPLSISEPRENGCMTNWDVAEELWRHAYAELHLDSSEHPVLTCDSPFSTLQQKESYMEMMFEKFNAPCMYLAYDSVLSAFSYGHCNALIVECGAGSTRVVPVHDGYVLKQPAQQSSLGGQKLTEYFENALTESNPKVAFTSRYKHALRTRQKLDAKELERLIPASTEKYMKMHMFEDMKAFLCQTASASSVLTSQSASLAEKEYILPDGQEISVGVDRFKIPELLFNPPESKGVHRLIYDSIQACDPDVRREMLNHMLLCGGGSCFPDFAARLHSEITRMIPSTFKVKLVSASSLEKRFSVFTGGSILASLGSFQQLWISKKEYDEVGGGKLAEDRCP